jgi:hypothetical protein
MMCNVLQEKEVTETRQSLVGRIIGLPAGGLPVPPRDLVFANILEE